MKNRGTGRSSHSGSLRANMCMFVVCSSRCPHSECQLSIVFKLRPRLFL